MLELAHSINCVAIPSLNLSSRRALEAPAGSSITDIVGLMLPGLPQVRYCQVRVSIGDQLVPQAWWDYVRPKPGTHVLVRVIPTGDTGRAILSLLVVVAALIVGNVVGSLFASSLIGGLVGGAAAAGVPACGQLKISALI